MSEQEIEQLALLLEKAKGTLTPIGKGGPDYITVNNGILIGHSMEFHNGLEHLLQNCRLPRQLYHLGRV